MRISELANRTNMAAHTIRFYESKGLLPKAKRGINGYRKYDEDSLQRLSSIQCAKRLGFSLEDILTVLADRGTDSGLDHDKVLQQLDTRLLEVDAMMLKLKQQKHEIKAFKDKLQANWQQGKCMQADEMKIISKLG